VFVCADSAHHRPLSPLHNCGHCATVLLLGAHVQLVDIDPCVWLLLLGTSTICWNPVALCFVAAFRLKRTGTSSLLAMERIEVGNSSEDKRRNFKHPVQSAMVLLRYSRHGKVVHLSDSWARRCAVKVWHRVLAREIANCHRHSAVWKLWKGTLKQAKMFRTKYYVTRSWHPCSENAEVGLPLQQVSLAVRLG